MGVVQNTIDIKTLGEALAGIGEDLVDVKEKANHAVSWTGSENYVGKNLINITASSNSVFTINNDGSVTADGSNNKLLILGTIKANDMKTNTPYILSKGTKANYPQINLNAANGDTYVKNLAALTNQGEITFTPDFVGYDNIQVIIYIPANASAEDVTVFPMIRSADIIEDSFEKHLPSNSELLPVATLKSVAAASSDFASFKTAIAAL